MTKCLPSDFSLQRLAMQLELFSSKLPPPVKECKQIQILCCKENWGALRPPNRWKQHWMLQATCWNHVADDKRPSTLSFHTIFVQSLCSPKVPSKETSTTPCLAKASSNFHWYANLRFAKFPEKSPLTQILKILCLCFYLSLQFPNKKY